MEFALVMLVCPVGVIGLICLAWLSRLNQRVSMEADHSRDLRLRLSAVEGQMAALQKSARGAGTRAAPAAAGAGEQVRVAEDIAEAAVTGPEPFETPLEAPETQRATVSGVVPLATQASEDDAADSAEAPDAAADVTVEQAAASAESPDVDKPAGPTESIPTGAGLPLAPVSPRQRAAATRPGGATTIVVEEPAATQEPAAPGTAAAPPGPIDPAPPSRGIEELLGMRLYIWLGAIALALSGTLLVKYTVDQGLIGPSVRVVLGTVFGLALVGSGEFMRTRSQRAGSGLTAGGVAVLMASFYAASTVFGLIPPWLGFVLMGLSAGLGVYLSLRQGPIVAAVGLFGGFLTPYLVRSGLDPSPAPLFLYLLLLQLGVLAVARRRGWWVMSALSMVAGAVWLLTWLLGPFEAQDGPWLYLYLLAAAGALLVSMWGVDIDTGASRIPRFLGLGTSAAAMMLAGLVIVAAGFGTFDWAFIGLLGAATIVLGALDRRYELMPWMTAGITGALLLGWAVSLYQDSYPEMWLSAAGATGAYAAVIVHAVRRFLPTTGALSALYVVAAYVVLLRSRRPHYWSALAAVSLVGGFLVARIGYELVAWSYLGNPLYFVGGVVQNAPPDLPWGLIGLALAALAAVGAAHLQRRREGGEEGTWVVTAPAMAATVLAAIAIILLYEDYRAPVLWSIELAAVVLVAWRLRLPLLRLLAWPLAALVALPLLTPVGVALTSPGIRPLVTWLPIGYGVPLVACAVAALVSLRDDDRRLSLVLRWGALVLGMVGITLVIRQAFHPGRLLAGDLALIESATYAIVWILVGILLQLAARRWRVDVLELGGQGVALLGIGAVVLGPVDFTNPLKTGEPVGTWRLVNMLLYAYGLPAGLAFVAAYLIRRAGKPEWARVGALLASGITVVFLALQVRQWFHVGQDLGDGGLSLVESATYGVVLLVAGLLLVEAARRWPLYGLSLAGKVTSAVGLGAAIAGPVALANPVLTGELVGPWRILNSMVYAYGLPALLGFAVARQQRRDEDEILPPIALVVGSGLTFVLATMQVRHWFHPESHLGQGGMGLVESATYGLVWMAAGIGLLWAYDRLPRREIAAVGQALIGIGIAAVIIGPVFFTNPLVTGEPVGTWPLVNWLLYAYGATGALALLSGHELRRRGEAVAGAIVQSAGLGLGFVLINLFVRQLFHGPVLTGHEVTVAENYVYSLVWVLYGVALLVAGIRGGSRLVRLASLAVMLMAVAKVFLYDAASLEDLYRVLSFLGLGLSLIGLALLYQKFVFRTEAH